MAGVREMGMGIEQQTAQSLIPAFSHELKRVEEVEFIRAIAEKNKS